MLCPEGVFHDTGSVGLAAGDLIAGMPVAGMSEAVHNEARLRARWVGRWVVHDNALAADPLQRVPDALGVDGSAVKAIDALSIRQIDTPPGGAVGAGVCASRERGPVGRRPNGERRLQLIDRTFPEHAFKVGQNALGDKALHHRDDETIHPVGVELVRHVRSVFDLRRFLVPPQ